MNLLENEVAAYLILACAVPRLSASFSLDYDDASYFDDLRYALFGDLKKTNIFDADLFAENDDYIRVMWNQFL